jgi:nucleotide-binding universal stress UspA family protein
MYTNILIPTEGSEPAGKAARHAIALKQRIGAKVTALTVLLPFHVFTTDTQMLEDRRSSTNRMREHAEKILVAVADAAQAAGVTCEMVHVVEHEHPYQAIIDSAG